MDEQRSSGVLFKNFRKKQVKHPDFTGNCEIKGVKYEMSAWEKPLRSGKGSFLSISFQLPRAQDNGLPVEGASTEPPPAPSSADSKPPSDDIPF